MIMSNECIRKGKIICRVDLRSAGGRKMGKCLHNTLNVSQVDTYVLSLKRFRVSYFLDSLEGVVETVTQAVCTSAVYLRHRHQNISSPVQLQQLILLLHSVRF